MSDLFDNEEEMKEEDIDSTLDQDSQSAIEEIIEKNRNV